MTILKIFTRNPKPRAWHGSAFTMQSFFILFGADMAWILGRGMPLRAAVCGGLMFCSLGMACADTGLTWKKGSDLLAIGLPALAAGSAWGQNDTEGFKQLTLSMVTTVGTAEVRVGQADGHSVAVTQRDGVGYAFATDLDPMESAELVDDGRKDATIDTVLGAAYTSVAPQSEVDTALAAPSPSPSGPGCSPTAVPTSESTAPAAESPSPAAS